MSDDADDDPRNPLSSESYRLYRDARSALDGGDHAGGIRLLRAAAGQMPHFKTYELLGETLLEQGQNADAVLYLSAAAGLGTKAFRAHYLLARALLALGPTWTVDAAKHLQHALRFNPNYKAARELLEKISPGEIGDLRVG